MTSKATLWWTVAVVIALTGGFVSGVWAGAATEQDALAGIIEGADLTADCQSQIDRALKDIISDWEAGPPPSP